MNWIFVVAVVHFSLCLSFRLYYKIQCMHSCWWCSNFKPKVQHILLTEREKYLRFTTIIIIHRCTYLSVILSFCWEPVRWALSNEWFMLETAQYDNGQQLTALCASLKCQIYISAYYNSFYDDQMRERAKEYWNVSESFWRRNTINEWNREL